MKKEKRNVLLVNLINEKYYGAYHSMIDELRPYLANPIPQNRPLERLLFKYDLPRGSKKVIYQAIARLLVAAPDGKVLRKGYTANDLFRWLSDSKNCNLGIKMQSIQRLVYQEVEWIINNNLTDDSNC